MKNNIPQGYKATALGIIPQEWEVKKLGEVGKLLSGLTYTPSNIQSDGILVLRSSNIQNGVLAFDDNVYVNVSSYTPVKAGDILICVRNGSQNLIGKTALITQEAEGCAFGAFMAVFRSPISKYVFYLLGTELYRKYIFRNLGATINSINGSDLKKFRFPFPPLAEQQKIAEVLGVWDEAIEKQARLIEKLALRKRALMQRLLSAKLRLPGFSEPWKKVKLGDIGDTYNGLSGKNKDDFEYGNAQFIPYINVFSNERIDTNNLGCVQIKPNEQQNTVKYGDIFFTVSSETPDEVGMASVLLEHLNNTHLNSFCFGYRLNNFSTLNPFFAAYLFRTEHFRNYMSVLAQGSTRFNISKKEVMKLKIDLPTIEEQTAIAEVLTAADREIELAKEKLERLRRQKRGLMQQLLTGKKRIKI